MQINCPTCRTPFVIPQFGVYTCPGCHGQVSIAAPAVAPRPRSNDKARLGTGLAVLFGTCVVYSAVTSKSEHRSSSTASETTQRGAPESAAASGNTVASGSAAARTSPCDVALPKLRAACPRAGGWLERECNAASSPVNTVTLDVEPVRPGSVIHFGSPGPEWFLRDDGTLLTLNGLASPMCNGLQDVPTFIGHSMIANAPKRGNTPKTYEGVYGPDGNYLHSDCSEFEIRIGRIYNAALWEDPESSDAAAGRRAAKAVKKAGVDPELGEQIYFKTVTQCMQAINVE